ncbi:MAG: hypothetical protein Q8S33_26005 [Myxococcales bacterium]|nr:hypothetical protein [Myxococcales bacterium]MDP3503818.1 hypothetical protein [Myxococcales bacterium]
MRRFQSAANVWCDGSCVDGRLSPKESSCTGLPLAISCHFASPTRP